jgi:thiamine biosynthesis protein ThiS
VRLTVNGEQRQVQAERNISALVALLGLDERKVAIERNLAIVPRSQWSVTLLADGDRIEIVHFVGGG